MMFVRKSKTYIASKNVKYKTVYVSTPESRKRDEIRKLNKRLQLLRNL